MRQIMIAGVALALAASCRSAPSMPVQLQGDPVSISWLTGNWVGEYWGGAGGRGGSLSFTLRGGSDSLYGDVTMLDPRGVQLRAADPMDAHRLHVRSPQYLRIDVVSVRADSIRGRLEPYIAPDCECTVTTTFFGTVKGGSVTGRFETRNAGRVVGEGSWELKRTGDAP